jgi:Bacterial membrane protein YfhO
MHDEKSSAAKFSDLIALTTLIALILWFCQDLIFGDQVPFFRDLGNYFYPLRFSLFESYRSAELPLWDRRFAMGFPLLAAFQSGVFYPPHFLLWVLPFFPAIRVIFVFHFLVAAGGAYALFRYWKYPCYLSIVAALLFTLGGVIVSLSNLLNHFQTAVWLPWLILSWEKALRVTSWKNFLVFAVTGAIQLLAGSPELFVMGMGLLLVDGLRVKSWQPGISYKKIVGVFLAASLLIVALTMAQLLPTAELFLQSRRQQPMHPQEVSYWSLDPLSLLSLFFLDKEVDLNVSIGTRLFFAREAAFFISYYLGAISLFGICLWFCGGSAREKVALGSLVLLSVILAFGSHTPIYPFLFTHVPIISTIRFPEKFFFLTYVLLLFAALRGLGDFLLRQERSIKVPFVVLTGICVVWVGLYLYLRLNSDLLASFISVKSDVRPLSVGHTKAIASILANVERQLVLSMAFLVVLILGRAKMIRASLCGLLLVLSVYVDLAWAHRSFLLALRPDFISESSRIMQGPDAEPNRLFYYPPVRNLHPSFVSILGRTTFAEAQALSFHDLLPNAGILYGFDYMQEMDALGRQPYTEFLLFANQLDFRRQLQLLRTFNVRYLVTLRPLPEEGITLIRQFPQYFSWLYEIKNSVPRAYLVNESVMEKSPNEVLKQLSSPSFDPTQMVVLDEKVFLQAKRPFVATAKIVRYQSQRVTIETTSNDSGILVFADSHYPGWKAYVDGREEPILRANHFFRAVVLREGEHVVEFKYEPLSFKVGSIASLVTVLFLVIISVTIFFSSRHSISNARQIG